ncbi:dienelactone hydrolase family protein [Nocardia fluminea]|uniref:dienelactone hydrolase family protein n=1 Tax=Nocardia fluminea TaxID=134984 RepID=UPI0033D1C7DC
MNVLATRTAPVVGEREIAMTCDGAVLEGCLRAPAHPLGLAVLAHGGSGDRHSPRHRFIADLLGGHRLATLTVDVLTAAESADKAKVLDVGLLGCRLVGVLRRLPVIPEARRLPVGLFGTGSAAPAVLWTAAEPDARVEAVAVRGGRPDLAGERLTRITAPTLLMVGGVDPRVLQHNRHAAELLAGECRVTELSSPGRSSRPGHPSWRAAYSAAVWFTEHLGAAAEPPGCTATRRR